VQVRLASVEQVPYEDYIRSLPRPTILYVMTMSPLPGQAVAQIDLPLAHAILERLLGGPGRPDDREGSLTEIELALLGTLANSIRASLVEAWAQAYPLQVTISDPVLNSEFVQVALPAETAAVLVLEINLGATSGSLSVCFPHPVLQPVVEQLTADLRFSSAVKEDSDTVLDFADQLTRVSVPIIAELGRAQVTLHDLLNLSVGRVIKLDTSAAAHIPIRIEDVAKFTGKPGVQGKNMAVQITNVLE
jgi:flagellar motor switch protein FliM